MIHKNRLPDDVEERLKDLSSVLAGHGEIMFAYLCGSLARGARTPLSDVDIGVYLTEGTDFLEAEVRLLPAISRHLQTDEVDLVILNRAPIALLGRLLSSRRVIFDRDPFLRHRFESRVIREYLDFRKFEQRLLARRYPRG